MGRTPWRVTAGVVSALLLMPVGYGAATVSSVAAASPPAHTVVSTLAPQARSKKKTKVRCVFVKKRIGNKIKKVKKCKKIKVKAKPVAPVVVAPPVLSVTPPPAEPSVNPSPTDLPSPTVPTPTPTAPPSTTEPTPTPPATSEPPIPPTSPADPVPVKPSVLTTGVPVGTGLTVYNGDLTITTPGTVIDSLDVRGYVSVKAPNVTIKRSIIRGGAAATVNRAVLAITTAGASNFLVEDVTIVPANPTPYVNGINVNQSGTIRRANVSGTVDGIMIYGSGVKVEQSYLHDFVHYLSDPNWAGGPSHDDAIQVQAGTGIQIVGNTLTGAFNSAVMVTQDAGTTKDLWINGNWIDYGGCSINYGSNGAYKTGMQANNNRFGRAQRVSGCAIIHNSAASDLVPVGNVWDDNGQPAGIKKGA